MDKGVISLLSQLQTEGERKIFWVIQKHDGISRTEIAELTGLTSSAVTQIVKRLIEMDLVAETETPNTRSVGRNRINVVVSGHQYCSLGIVMRRWDVQWVVTRLDGQLLYTTETLLTGSARENVAATLTQVNGWLSQSGRELVSVGIGIPTFATKSIPIPEFLDSVREQWQVPYVTSSNACYAAFAEERTVVDSSPHSFLYVFAGGGIGGAVVRRRPLGELPDIHVVEAGHVGIDPQGEPCICGNRGCVELSASPIALARAAGIRSLSPTKSELCRVPESLTVKATQDFTYGLTSIANVLDVSDVILGGYDEPVLRHLYGRLPQLMNGHITPSGEPLFIRFSNLGLQAAAVGAAVGAIHGFGVPVSTPLVANQH